jgi:hypothetical protein
MLGLTVLVSVGGVMASTKRKGDLAELKVATDLVELGYQVAFPFGEDSDFDLILVRGSRLERVQVKHSRSKDGVIPIKCRSHSLTNGRIRRTKRYTANVIDWIAVYDGVTDRCFYVPANELGEGMSQMHLRLTPARNGQEARIRYAARYTRPDPTALQTSLDEVEPAGFEPATSDLQNPRSSN